MANRVQSTVPTGLWPSQRMVELIHEANTCSPLSRFRGLDDLPAEPLQIIEDYAFPITTNLLTSFSNIQDGHVRLIFNNNSALPRLIGNIYMKLKPEHEELMKQCIDEKFDLAKNSDKLTRIEPGDDDTTFIFEIVLDARFAQTLPPNEFHEYDEKIRRALESFFEKYIQIEMSGIQNDNEQMKARLITTPSRMVNPLNQLSFEFEAGIYIETQLNLSDVTSGIRSVTEEFGRERPRFVPHKYPSVPSALKH